MRIAISFCRAAVRASSRFDRLAQTISMTIPTAPASTKTARPDVAADVVGKRPDEALEAVALRMLAPHLRRKRA